MTIGFHCPLPPAKTGVADYGATLLESLRERANVLVNSREPADAELYHLGNNLLHGSIYERALSQPGVVVLHDAVLQHFFLGALDESAYAEEFVHNYGEWNRELGGRLWRGRSRSGVDADYFRYPMLRRIVEASHAVVVHNPAAARAVRQHGGPQKVVEIPHLFRAPAPPAAYEVERLRRALEVPSGGTLFGVLGFLRESKRLQSVLRAFEHVHRICPKTRLLVAGAFVSGDLERALASRLAMPGVIRVGHLPEDEFWRHAWATDVCVNLRYPAAGETSGIGIRFMGIGKTTIVSEGEENASLPGASCIRVDTGAGEVEMLAGYMQWLAESPGAARAIGRQAARHIAAEHDVELCAARYLEAVEAGSTASASSTPAPAPSLRPDRR